MFIAPRKFLARTRTTPEGENGWKIPGRLREEKKETEKLESNNKNITWQARQQQQPACVGTCRL